MIRVLEGIGDFMNNVRNCQFYIILGEKDFRPKNDGNVYINATGAQDMELIRKAVYNAFYKKRDEGVQIASKIIFLISDQQYISQCQNIIDHLGLNGDIQYLPKKEEVLPQNVSTPVQVEAVYGKLHEESTFQESTVLDQDISNTGMEQMEEKITEEQLEEKKEEQPKYSYQPKEDLVFHGDLDLPIGGGTAKAGGDFSKDAANYMGYNPTLINSNVKSLVKKPGSSKSAGFAKLPIIIFILSALLLVASIILLFVLD